MSRHVFTKTKVDIGVRLLADLGNGQFAHTDLYKDDTVTDLKYTENDEVKKVTGRIADIVVTFLRGSNGRQQNYDSTIDDDAKVVSVAIDKSTENHSDILTIPADKLLEYNLPDNVTSLKIIPVIKVKITDIDAAGNETGVEVTEGSKLFGTTIIDNQDPVTGNYTVRSFMYAIVKHRNVEVVGLNLVGDRYVSVPFEDIISIGTSGENTTAAEFTAKLTSAATDPSKPVGLGVGAGEITDDLTLQNSVIISGNKSGMLATNPSRLSDTIGKDETVIKGTLNVSDDAHVTLSGVTLTEKSTVKLGKAKSFTLKNSKIVNLTPTDKKTMGVLGTFDEDGAGTVVDIEGCYFGTNTTNSTGSIYNFFELNTKLANGSKINNNYFAKSVCTHNVINIYAACDNANIEIANNHFEYSGNAIRVGIKGDRQNVTLNVHDNKFDETDTSDNGIWAGLLLVQPYGKETKSMHGVTINLNNNHGMTPQMVYGYYNASGDTVMNAETLPTVMLNGTNVTNTMNVLSM